MRNFSRLGATIVAAVLIGACGSAASPSPVATSIPTAHTPSRAPSTPVATTLSTASPSPIQPATAAIAAGYRHTCVITTAGGVKCWGSNSDGELGNGATSEEAGTVAVDVRGLSSGVSAITTRGMHTCALTTGGRVRCWGDNEYGQLGNGAIADSSVPVEVSGLSSGVTAIAAGWGHTCVLTESGGVKCWGNNPFGALGDGTRVDRAIAVDVSGLASGVSAIAAGGRHTCALKRTGGVTCWGDGQSDDPDRLHTSVPVDVPELGTDVTAITAGNDQTCALTNRGAITCWGSNFAPPPGQSLPERFVQIDVSGIDGAVTAIAAGENHACALTSQGGIACWGNNSYGQLGRNMTYDSVAVDVAGLAEGFRAIAGGGMHTCALGIDGAVKCWGSNSSGQLGSVLRCSTTSVPIDVPLDGNSAGPPASLEPGLPIGPIEHGTAATDVVLRFDVAPDLGVSELSGEYFAPGPEFTLYGDGTVIFKTDRTPPPPAERPVVRGRPFVIAHLDEDRVQALLRYAIGDGGLATACDRYETTDTDGFAWLDFTLRAGDLDRRVQVAGPSPLDALIDRLGNFDPGAGVSTRIWEAQRYWGSLLDAGQAIEIGLLPTTRDAGIAAWPWPHIAPADFVGRDEGGWVGEPRRIMSADDAAVLGLSADGGVVQRIYLRGPDGKTVYSFSLWPMSPDERS